MKLAKVKVEYTGGTTITERVTLDPETGQVHLPPRLQKLLAAMDETECSPAFGLEYDGFVLPVTVQADGTHKVTVPDIPAPGVGEVLKNMTRPTKDQRQQNARYMHTLSAASIGGAVGYAHAAGTLDLQSVAGTLGLAAVGVLLWYAGVANMKGD
jgi:hypothetical protein